MNAPQPPMIWLGPFKDEGLSFCAVSNCTTGPPQALSRSIPEVGAREFGRGGLQSVTPAGSLAFHMTFSTLKRAATFAYSWTLAACAGSNSDNQPAECGLIIVSIDAGTDVFAQVGEFKSGIVCSAFCDKDHMVCSLRDPTHVDCSAGCQ
jgi:hypothetical protein